MRTLCSLLPTRPTPVQGFVDTGEVKYKHSSKWVHVDTQVRRKASSFRLWLNPEYRLSTCGLTGQHRETRQTAARPTKVHSVYIIVDLVAPNYKAELTVPMNERASEIERSFGSDRTPRKSASGTSPMLPAWRTTRIARPWPVSL